MIVAVGKQAITGGDMVIVGLTEEDIETMRKGLTKTKQGGPEWGFRSMMVFMGKSDQEMLAVLQQGSTVRSDDMLPDAGSG